MNMNKQIKGMQAIVLILSCALIFAGCGNAKNVANQRELAAETAPASSAAAEPVEIEFWYGGNQLTSEQIEEYNGSQTKVKVKAVVVQNYYDGIVEKLQVQAAAKKLPDVVQMGLLYTKFADEKVHAVPLEPLMEKDKFDTDDFFPNMLNLGKTSEGKQIGIPGGISSPVLFYNADQFREAGLDPDVPPKTWDEVREYAKKLTKENRYGFFVAADDSWQYQALMQTFGGSMMAADGKSVGLDSPESVKAVQFVSDLINVDKSMPMLEQMQSFESMGKGNVSMLVSSGATLELIRSYGGGFDLRAAPYPTQDGKRSVAAGGYNLMIFSTDEAKQEASWDFIKFMTDTKRSVQVAKSTGYMVARKSALNDPEMAQFLKDNPAANATYEQIEQLVPWFNFPGGTKLQKIISDQVQAVLQKQKNAPQAMKDAAELANALNKS